MQIVRTEVPSGGPDRTRREEIVSLLPYEQEAEPEFYLDCSESEGWAWNSRPGICTWDIQVEAVRQVIVPFEQLDSQAAEEQKNGDDDMGGVYAYPFSNVFLPLGKGKNDGDLNSANFQRKMADFCKRYFDGNTHPVRGGTAIMAAIKAGDEHFMGEFRKEPRDERPVRLRMVFTDGALNDSADFRRYLSQATRNDKGYGAHGEWDEVWLIAIIGETDGGGKEAYNQYKALSQDHAWIHAYYFQDVVNTGEIAEDVAIAAIPGQSA